MRMVSLFSTLLPCTSLDVSAQAQLAIRFGERVIAGTGLVELHGDSYVLTMLSPAGTALFSVSGPPRSVDGPPDWTPWLRRLPIERDLRLIWTSKEGMECRAWGGRYRMDEAQTRWTGPGGRATLHLEEGRFVVEDKRRGYTLTLVEVGP